MENELGTLKKISGINRNRFKILNDADWAVDMHVAAINQEV